MLAKLLLILAVFAVVWFILLKPSPAAPTEPWYLRIKNAWNDHGQTWKRWACFIAGILVTIVALLILGA